jgi:chromosome segregation ATPase
MTAATISRMGAGVAGAAWEIVDIGSNTWEVVVVDASTAEPADPEGERPLAADRVEPPEAPEPPEALAARLSRTDSRLDAVERRLGELTRHEQRLDGLELAQAQTERRLEERHKELRAEIEAIYRQAEREVAESTGKPGWRQRRLEVKLARLERDRKLRRAEERLAERSETLLAAVEREGVAARASLRSTRHEVDAGRERLTRLIERIEAAEERVRAADERASAARLRALDPQEA